MGDSRLSRLVVREEHLDSINSLLDHLVEEGSAKFALLVDRSGQLVTSRGETGVFDVNGLGALLAGNFASAREIARLVGEATFDAVFQQGQHQSVFTALVSEHWMLSVVFEARMPVGMVKVLCGRVSAELQDVHREVCQSNPSTANEWTFGGSFRVLAQRNIDQLLRDGK